MMGFFTPDREPSLSLEIRGPEDSRAFDGVIDTGFNGGLTLPSNWIETLGLPRIGEDLIVLADGHEATTPVYVGYVILDEHAYETPVAVAPSPLIGTDLLWGFSLYIEFRADGAVEVESLPTA